MENRFAKDSFVQQRLTAVFAGTSPRWAWWLSLGLLIGGFIWAQQTYESNLSFFLRRADAGATAKSVIVASMTMGIFIIVTLRRANELRASAKARWTLLLPPLWLFWFPVLGAMKPVTAEAPDSLKRLTQRVAGIGTAVTTVIVAILAVAWWMRLEPDVSSKGQRVTEPYDCIREGNRAMARLETWPLTMSGEDVFIHVIRRCAENGRAF